MHPDISQSPPPTPRWRCFCWWWSRNRATTLSWRARISTLLSDHHGSRSFHPTCSRQRSWTIPEAWDVLCRVRWAAIDGSCSQIPSLRRLAVTPKFAPTKTKVGPACSTPWRSWKKLELEVDWSRQPPPNGHIKKLFVMYFVWSREQFFSSTQLNHHKSGRIVFGSGRTQFKHACKIGLFLAGRLWISSKLISLWRNDRHTTSRKSCATLLSGSPTPSRICTSACSCDTDNT